jgi:hypothetical protein
MFWPRSGGNLANAYLDAASTGVCLKKLGDG